MGKLEEQEKEEIGKKIEEESCRVGIRQRYYMGGTIKGSMKNIGDDWRRIGTNGRKRKKEKKELMKKRKKKKLRKEE